MQFRLWARMIENGVHASKDIPPQVPMITGNTPHRTQKKDNFQDTLVSTATAVLKAVSQHSPNSSIVQFPQGRN